MLTPECDISSDAKACQPDTRTGLDRSRAHAGPELDGMRVGWPPVTLSIAAWQCVAIYLLLTALIWAVFGQTTGHGFVNYDDQTYVYQNRTITAGLTKAGF